MYIYTILSRTVLSTSIAALLLIPGISFAQAQTTQSASTTFTPKTYLLADVSLKDCNFSFKESRITSTCNIINKGSAQTDIRYSVNLTDKKTNALKDQKVGSESITLRENETISKTFVYEVSPFLQGDFSVWISLDTVDALPLSQQRVGAVSLAARSHEYIQLGEDTCYLTITGDTKKYELKQGVDFDADEVVTLTCVAQNMSSTTALVATPSFETHLRTSVGTIVPDTADAQVAVSIAAHTQKTIALVLPKALSPQAYDTLLTLKSSDGTAISNTVRIHYVLRGASATVQVLSLDKDYYAAGTTARVTLWWTGSADTFAGARKPATNAQATTIQIALRDGKGNECGAPLAVPITKAGVGSAKPETFSLPVTSECTNPSVTTGIVDASGKLLVEKTVSLTGSQVPGTLSWSIFFWILAFLALGLLAFIFVKYRQYRMRMGALLFFLVFSIPMHHASAATFYRIDDVWFNGDVRTTTFTAELNKSVYAPGEPVVISGKVISSYCNNGYFFTAAIFAKNLADGTKIDLTDGFIPLGDYWSPGLTAPQSAGNYGVQISSMVGNYFNEQFQEMTNQAEGAGDEIIDPKLLTYSVSAESCELPWGESLPHGMSTTSYQTSSASAPTTCSSISETLTCTNGHLDGSYTSQSCTQFPQPPSVTFTATPLTVNMGSSTMLHWSSMYADSCTSAGGFSTDNAVHGDTLVGPLSENSTYQLSCTGSGGTTNAQQVVTVRFPQVSITAMPQRVLTNGTSTISWNATDVSSCTIAGPGFTSTNKSGSVIATITTQSTFTITCDSSIIESTIVNVGPIFEEH